MFKIDLHTHSTGSVDGGLRATEYKRALEEHRLDYIAVTDHNTIEEALRLQRELGDSIIVGEEVTTDVGEIIGLYLSKPIPANLSLAATVAAIQAQHGLVYVPHPFETKRSGVSESALQEIISHVDIIEVFNGRAWAEPRHKQAHQCAETNHKPGAASSDAHGWYGWGKTYSCISTEPTRDNLVQLLAAGTLVTGSTGIRGALYPTLNRARKRFA